MYYLSMDTKFCYNDFNTLESKISDNLDLLEIASGYCEVQEYDSKIITLSTILKIIITNQKEILEKLDSLIVV